MISNIVLYLIKKSDV